jgi:hypothetical protein
LRGLDELASGLSPFKSFKRFNPFEPPPHSSPATVGEDKGGGVEPFGFAQDRLREAVEQLERLELGVKDWRKDKMK